MASDNGEKGDGRTTTPKEVFNPDMDPEKPYAGRVITRRRALEMLLPFAIGAAASPYAARLINGTHPAQTPDDKRREEISEIIGKDINFTIVTPEFTPKISKLYDQIYDALLALMPEDQRGKYPKPTVVLLSSGGRNARFQHALSGDESVIEIQIDEILNASDTELIYKFGHELGHWLMFNDKELAKELSGFNSKEVQPVLEKLRQFVDATIHNKDEAQERYELLCRELIGDGLGVRISHDALASIKDLMNGVKAERERTIRAILDRGDGITKPFWKYSPPEKKRLQNELGGILVEIDNNAVTDHPPEKIRDEFMRRAAEHFGYQHDTLQSVAKR